MGHGTHIPTAPQAQRPSSCACRGPGLGRHGRSETHRQRQEPGGPPRLAEGRWQVSDCRDREEGPSSPHPPGTLPLLPVDPIGGSTANAGPSALLRAESVLTRSPPQQSALPGLAARGLITRSWPAGPHRHLLPEKAGRRAPARAAPVSPARAARLQRITVATNDLGNISANDPPTLLHAPVTSLKEFGSGILFPVNMSKLFRKAPSSPAADPTGRGAPQSRPARVRQTRTCLCRRAARTAAESPGLCDRAAQPAPPAVNTSSFIRFGRSHF